MVTLTQKQARNPLTSSKDGTFALPLGNIANISSAGTLQPVADNKEHNISTSQRKKQARFELLDTARKILRENNTTTSRSNNPHRTRHCLAVRYDKSIDIGITLNDDPTQSAAGLDNLVTCGSICSCPVCAHKKMMEYAQDIKKALKFGENNNLMPIMLTLTARHHKNANLEEFIDAFKSAWRYFASGRVWRGFKLDFGILYSITAREITRQRWQNDNGWHYHMHILLFLDKGVVAERDIMSDITTLFTDRWMTALAKNGLTGLPEIACNISAGEHIGNEYLTKIGLTQDAKGKLEYELTGNANKGATIWDILKDAGNGDLAAAKLYLEYVAVMTGENWITFSHGFRKLIEDIVVEDDTDNENEQTLFYWVDQETWSLIVRAGEVGKLLNVAARYRSTDRIAKFIKYLKIAYEDNYHDR